MKKLSAVVLATTVFSLSSLAKTNVEAAVHHPNLNSTLWYQTSAEFRANSLQSYKMATLQLPALLKDTSQTALLTQTSNYQQLPAAVIVDIDETILDNSATAASDVKRGFVGFDAVQWNDWVLAAKAPAVPGAVAFLNKASELGIKVLFISNRECKASTSAACPQKDATIHNLKAVGVKDVSSELVWLKGEQPDWTSEKESRRLKAQQQYRVIMLAGDDFGDFLPNVKKDITPAQRFSLVDKYQDYWGSRWIMLANPTYGSWETILRAPKTQYLRDVKQ